MCVYMYICFETDMVPNAFRQIPLSSVAWLTIYFLQHPVPKMCPFKYKPKHEHLFEFEFDSTQQ
jgi:hypothetical protein